jgi:tetraacyldisaccharide 4'-kinase
VSVGNLVWGGTGKTPFVLMIASHYLSRGRRVAIISRGYGRRSRGPLVVADGRKILVGVEASGDEAMLVARRLPGAVVVVSEDRVEGSRRAAQLGSDFFLFDDAFQHLALKRDVDIVLLDASRPFGGGLPPSGRAREPASALRRAQIVILTRCEGPSAEPEARIAPFRDPEAAVFHSRLKLTGWIGTEGALVPLEHLSGKRVAAFCAVGNPESFRQTLRENVGEPAAFLSFRDHHFYGHGDLRRIEALSLGAGASCLVTTEKDLVKMPAQWRPDLLAARIEPEIAERGFFEAIDRLLAGRGVVS